MKKFTTKLLMSIIAVAFAFVALGTSTYAWFSMNTTVEAEGLTITAKADETFLLISKTHSAAEDIQDENETAVDFGMAAPDTDAELYPVTYGGSAYTISDLETKTNWKVAYSSKPDEPQIEKETTALTAQDDLTKYVLEETVYVTVAKDAVAAKNLKVSEVTIPANKGIKVVIATSTAGSGVLANGTDLTSQASLIGTSTITDTTVITVKIFVYFDGADSNVYQTNLANLTGEIGFKLTAENANKTN